MGGQSPSPPTMATLGTQAKHRPSCHAHMPHSHTVRTPTGVSAASRASAVVSENVEHAPGCAPEVEPDAQTRNDVHEYPGLTKSTSMIQKDLGHSQENRSFIM